jgi:Protein of unknown function (DUF429)
LKLARGAKDKEHAMSQNPNSAVDVVGIDIGKNSFHVVGLDTRGAIVLRQKWSRGQVEARLANMSRCLIGMEACVSRPATSIVFCSASIGWVRCTFANLLGGPLVYRKARLAGRDERRRALARSFSNPNMIEKSGRDQGLPVEDILDAVVACWSAGRVANGHARSLTDTSPPDATGLPMAIWV